MNVEINERGKLTGGHSIADGNVNIVSRGMPNEQGIYSAKISVSDPKTLLKLLQNINNVPDSWSADRIKIEVEALIK